MIENLKRYTMVIRRDKEGYATPALKIRQKGEVVKFSELEEALRTATDNTSSLKSICPNCTRQLSGHNFDEKCSIWRRCVVIECDDFHGYSK